MNRLLATLLLLLATAPLMLQASAANWLLLIVAGLTFVAGVETAW